MSFHIKVHGTGSSGNCMAITVDETRILVDAGLRPSMIKDSFSDISGIFLTHDHQDHNMYAGEYAHKYDIPVYGSKGTLENTNGIPKRLERMIMPRATYKLNNIYFVAFRVEHDAADPYGYMFMDSFNNTLAFISETGNLSAVKVKADFYIVEANYSVSLIESAYDSGKINNKLYDRIYSPVGHTPVEDAVSFAIKVKRPVYFHHASKSRFGNVAIPDNVIVLKNGDEFSFGEMCPY